jgi:hypothetical protein
MNRQGKQSEFVIGEVYFAVKYPDVQGCYPGIDSYVYLGMNFSYQDKEDTWYFQPSSEFARLGSAIDQAYRTKGKRPHVFCATKEMLSDFNDLDGLILELRKAAKIRKSKTKVEYRK